MRLKFSTFAVLLITSLAVINGPQNVGGSWWDGIPIVSQIKSGFQALTGDTEGAKKTQENFVNQAPVISQIKSAGEAIAGDKEAAKKTQEQFLKETIEPVADNTPIVGHIKGGIHIATGDEEKGKNIIKGASSSTAALIGGILGGPAGSIAAGAAADGFITGVDSAINKEFSPFGIVDYVANINNASAGDHFDALLGLGTEFVGGKAAKKKPGKKEGGFGVDGSNKRKFKDFKEFDGVVRESKIETGDASRRRLTKDLLPETRFDPADRRHLQIARERTGLPRAFSKRLEAIDFREINDVQGNMNCYYCSLAALKGKTVTQLRKEIKVDMISTGAPDINYIVNLYHKAGFPHAKKLFEGTPHEFLQYLDDHLKNGDDSQFSLAFTREDGTGHVIHARTWKNLDGSGQLMTTDFQHGPFSPNRFSTRLPLNVKTLYIVFPKYIRNLGDLQFSTQLDLHKNQLASLLQHAGDGGFKCNNKRRVIGYLPNWSMRPFTVEQAMKLTNVIYAFMVMNADGSLHLDEHAMSKERLIDVVIARQAHVAKNLRLEVSFAIGGWANSQHFSNVLNNANSRTFLVSEIERTIVKYNFDGVDIDWEYPITGGATEGTRADKGNYVTFLRELRQKLGKNRLISIAGGAGQEALGGFDVPKIIKYVDWIGVMSYDFFGAWESEWGAFVGPNSPLHHSAPPGYSGKLNVEWIIKKYSCLGEQPHKIVMGVPFYGRFWYKTTPGAHKNYPLYRKAERLNNGSYGGSAAYFEILDQSHIGSSSGYKTYWDDKSKTPWATDGVLVMSYENERSISEKVKFANKHNLGGVMIWSVDQDDLKYTLLNTVFKGACYVSVGNGHNFKCNPLGTETRWWTWLEDKNKAGMCGKNAPLYNGFYALCDPDDPGYSCCSGTGYCGSGSKFCDCPKCADYGKNPDLLVKEPVKPSRAIAWHIGFDLAKPGKPRCGSTAPKLANGKEAICNPDGDDYCCSSGGYCGSGDDFCECDGCMNHRTGKLAGQSGDQRWYTQHDGDLAGKCGPKAPKIDGHVPICNPRDPGYHCCSTGGFCGTGKDYCECKGCVNYAKTIKG